MDFIDHLADFDRAGRADALFAKDQAIGAPLISLHAVPDLPKAVQQRLFMLRFEDLVDEPAAQMSQIYSWLGLSPFKINPEKLSLMGPQESDSHYGMKFLHTQSDRVRRPRQHHIPPRIQAQIETGCAWYYNYFYPKSGSSPSGPGQPGV